MKETEKLFSGRLCSLVVGEFLNPGEQLEFWKALSLVDFLVSLLWEKGDRQKYWQGNWILGLGELRTAWFPQRLHLSLATNLQFVWGLLRKKLGKARSLKENCQKLRNRQSIEHVWMRTWEIYW